MLQSHPHPCHLFLVGVLFLFNRQTFSWVLLVVLMVLESLDYPKWLKYVKPYPKEPDYFLYYHSPLPCLNVTTCHDPISTISCYVQCFLTTSYSIQEIINSVSSANNQTALNKGQERGKTIQTPPLEADGELIACLISLEWFLSGDGCIMHGDRELGHEVPLGVAGNLI